MPELENWAFALLIAFMIAIFLAIIIIVILAANGAFKKKKDDDEEEEEEDPEAEEDDDQIDGDFGMKTAAAQNLVGEIVAAQVPDATTEEESTDSELTPTNDATSTGAAELISSIISAIDDVDVNEDAVRAGEAGGVGSLAGLLAGNLAQRQPLSGLVGCICCVRGLTPHTACILFFVRCVCVCVCGLLLCVQETGGDTGGEEEVADDPIPTSDATNALISEVLSDNASSDLATDNTGDEVSANIRFVGCFCA